MNELDRLKAERGELRAALAAMVDRFAKNEEEDASFPVATLPEWDEVIQARAVLERTQGK